MTDQEKEEKSTSGLDAESDLRRRAETHLKKDRSRQESKDLQAQSLVFELEVHQEELKIQNEDLRRSQQETAELLHKYTDLYEFAPVGYFTIDAENTVVQANLRGAEMIGCTKSRLLDRHFGAFVYHEDLPILQDLRERCMNTGSKQSCEIRMVSSRGVFDAQLHGRRIDETEPPLLQIAAFDITARREAERALQKANRRLEETVRQRTAELQFVAENTIHLLERERRKISLELHDTIAQDLATVKLLLENKLAMMDPRTSPSPFSIERISDIVGRSLNETRRIMNYLRPKMLDEIGFMSTLRWHWQEFERLHPDIVVHKDIRVSESDLPEDLILVVYRIVQEATHNLSRHSRADQVDFSLLQEDNRLLLRISDNGNGFDPDKTEIRRDKGMGITSMKERAKLTGGKFSLQSGPGEGTSIEVNWDLKRWTQVKR